jgi:hypothetical protein
MSLYTGQIFILDTTIFSPDSTYSTGAQTNFPLSNIADRIHPFRSYRSSVAPSTAVEIVYDLGASPPKVNSVFIDNTNVLTWKIQHSAAITSGYTDWLAATTSQIDNLTGRVKVFLDTSSLSQNARYLKVVSSAQTAVLSPLDAVKIGGITIGTDDNVMELPGGGTNNVEITQNIPTLITNFQNGAIEPTQVGEPFVEIVIPNDQYLRDTQEEEIAAILNMGVAPFVFFENASDLSRAYLVRHSQYKNKLNYQVSKVINVPLSFTEVI